MTVGAAPSRLEEAPRPRKKHGGVAMGRAVVRPALGGLFGRAVSVGAGRGPRAAAVEGPWARSGRDPRVRPAPPPGRGRGQSPGRWRTRPCQAPWRSSGRHGAQGGPRVANVLDRAGAPCARRRRRQRVRSVALGTEPSIARRSAGNAVSPGGRGPVRRRLGGLAGRHGAAGSPSAGFRRAPRVGGPRAVPAGLRCPGRGWCAARDGRRPSPRPPARHRLPPGSVCSRWSAGGRRDGGPLCPRPRRPARWQDPA